MKQFESPYTGDVIILESIGCQLKCPLLCVLVTEHGKIKLTLTRKLPPCCPAFINLESVMQISKGRGAINRRTQLWALETAIMTSLTRYAHGCNSGLGAIGATPSWLDLRPAPQEETHAWFCKSGFTGPTGKLNTIILLNRHSIKLPLNVYFPNHRAVQREIFLFSGWRAMQKLKIFLFFVKVQWMYLWSTRPQNGTPIIYSLPKVHGPFWKREV